MQNHPDGIVLFSGGLDSMLTVRLLQDMGLKILCIHFTSPFFGNAAKVAHWRNIHELEIELVDASEPFVSMLAAWPPHGIGKTLNPCVDCKITMLKLAKQIMFERCASFIATGEVLGQRPMSQRVEALNIIAKESETRGILLRPLSAQLLPPTDAENSGLVTRDKLLKISGRGRSEQLELAWKLGIKEIPNPAGGCRLTERENARRYWPLFKPYLDDPVSLDVGKLVGNLKACDNGRLLFHNGSGQWLCIGRNENDNARISQSKREDDLILKLPFPGPLAMARGGVAWAPEIVREAAAILASYAPQSRRTGAEINIGIFGTDKQISVFPDRHENTWNLPTWETVADEIRKRRKAHEASRQTTHCQIKNRLQY